MLTNSSEQMTKMDISKGFLKLVADRQSDRAYLSKPIEEEKIINCIEAARFN